MIERFAKKDIIDKLQKEVLSLQGYRTSRGNERTNTGLGPIENAFPGKSLPTGVVHEFISPTTEDAAATAAFITCLLGSLTKENNKCLWVGTKRTLFPPGLSAFGIHPENVIFIDLFRQKDVLWTIEEALKCNALSAVVGEIKELSFTESRRLQLAVEQSGVTGFIHRTLPRFENTVACVTRWKIKTMPGISIDGMPGLGFPSWKVGLEKVRNGKPGEWQVQWSNGRFRYIIGQKTLISETPVRKIG